MEEITESRNKNFPTALIIGPSHYLKSIANYFDARELKYRMKRRGESVTIAREDGLAILSRNPLSALGWRIILESDKPEDYELSIKNSILQRADLPGKLSGEYLAAVRNEISRFAPNEHTVGDEEIALEDNELDIRLTTYEGSKGLSAQHVYILSIIHI